MTLLRNELSGLAFPSTSMNTAGMLRLCFPSAIGISLPNLELPIISLILSAYSLKASGDYAIALSTFMFANTFVCPLCAVVSKMKKSAETLMFSALLVGAVLDIESVLLKILGISRRTNSCSASWRCCVWRPHLVRCVVPYS